MPTGAVRRVSSAPRRLARAGLAHARTLGWPPGSHLFAVGDGGGWSVDEDARHVEQVARRLGYEVGHASWAPHARRQAVFHTSQFTALRSPWPESSHRLGVAYYHGRPGTPGHLEFDRYFGLLRDHRHRFAAVQVTHAEMRDLVCEAGVEPARVFVVPIGVDLEHFPLGDADARRTSRERLGVPTSAFVVGSFQKDGVGWREGDEPKRVKGPDVLVDTLSLVRERVPGLVALLLGPSRGYVRAGLERAGVPYVHASAATRAELGAAYHALDAYLVASRQEGGPKGALESMAAGAPLVSTRVGQVPDIATDGVDAFLADPDNAPALADALVSLAALGADELSRVRNAARRTAEKYALERLDPLWAPALDALLPGAVGG